uniref:Uncharacterized protein n=1 Tax=Mola mola TaxID=94237 RepID=A0A3Q3VL43_MOLML
MSGYIPDEMLQRQWLKDQELCLWEPGLQAKPPGPIIKFWAGFMEPKSLPFGSVELKPKLFPGYTILE